VTRLKELWATLDPQWRVLVRRPDWILLEGGYTEQMDRVLSGFSGPRANDPSAKVYRLSFFPLAEGRFGLQLQPGTPPAVFCSLLHWLGPGQGDPPDPHTAGWLTAPATGVRYCLVPPWPWDSLEPMSGLSLEGYAVEVATGDVLSRTFGTATCAIPEPRGQRGPATEFVIRVSAGLSSSNPGFLEQAEDPLGPQYLLEGILWGFQGGPFASLEEFVAAARPAGGWNPGEIVLDGPHVSVRYTRRSGGEPQRDTVLKLKSDNGEFFTAGELLYKIHNAACRQLRRSRVFFRGLVREQGKEAITDEPARYRLIE
jgi:hypothetical protein